MPQYKKLSVSKEYRCTPHDFGSFQTGYLLHVLSYVFAASLLSLPLRKEGREEIL